MSMKRFFLFLLTSLVALSAIAQQPDPDFFIYLCFGQSNMEAGAVPAEQDKGFNTVFYFAHETEYHERCY